MKKHLLILPLLLANFSQALAFCGFYVAKADAKLFNKSSSVIIVRDGTLTTITMSSDFQGDLKDFAMVVPVPEVLKKNQIRIAEQAIFDKLDAYSGPRLVEYYDQNPCQWANVNYLSGFSVRSRDGDYHMEKNVPGSGRDLGVKILETYTVGEYDILILSAKESDGLETWLTLNDYKIPQGASEILEPYIKSDMKFFVVKVNLDDMKSSESQTLRPIQMTFNSNSFMLPIRLGMANADGDQDMIVYGFTRKGRIETSNYRTQKITTDKNVPLFVKDRFGEFYKDLFNNDWGNTSGKNVMLEYAWDLSSSNFVKCDPCPVQPPVLSDLKQAGIKWLAGNDNSYIGNLFMTRLHVRYNRENYPQDLKFMVTPNKENFQGRYIMMHPVKGSLECEQGQNYITRLKERRELELRNLELYANWDITKYQDYATEFDSQIGWKKGKNEKNKRNFVLPVGFDFPTFLWGLIAILISGMILFQTVYRRRQIKLG